MFYKNINIIVLRVDDSAEKQDIFIIFAFG